MRTRSMVAGMFVLGSVGALAATTLVRPQGRFEVVAGRLRYDPKPACEKPQRPPSADQAALDGYRQAVTRHLNCLQAATSADIRYASDAILGGYNEAVANFSDEVRDSY